MAKQPRPEPLETAPAVTAERAARLHRLVQILATGPQTRDALRRRLRLDVRSFYRDLELLRDLLRDSAVAVPLEGRHYRLEGSEAAAVALLPFPDPHLRFGEVAQLARGRTAAAQKLREQLAQLTKSTKRKRGSP
jgi:hypothetical protein